MAFPVVARYFVNFRNSDTGLTLTAVFKRADTFAGVGSPTFFEVSNGEYYFDWTWTTSADPDLTFVIDGGASIPTEEVRYVKGVISPRDRFIDVPLSEVPDAVWDETTASHTAVGSFGQTLQLEHSGLAQAGGASTVTLSAGASATNEFYKNGLITITSGTGVGQARSINSYVGATRVATVDRAWSINPANGSGYIVLPAAPASSLTGPSIAAAVWDEALAGHLTAGTTGAALAAAGTGVQFYANGDTVNPIIFSVASPKHTQVRVTFSEPVVMTTDPEGALNLMNYSIGGLTIIAVEALTSQQVLLTTSSQTPNFLYTLTITNVEDLAGNPI